jgi:hypothetical protein
MLTLFVGVGQNFEQLLPNSDWLALVADLSLPLRTILRVSTFLFRQD